MEGDKRVTAAASHVLKVSNHDTSPVLTTLFFVSRGDEIDGNQLVRRQPLLVDTTKQNHLMFDGIVSGAMLRTKFTATVSSGITVSI